MSAFTSLCPASLASRPPHIRLSHEKADKLVYCHEALHLQNKLQKAGYEVKVERWDTDSDSNASDEEDLKQ